MENSCFPSLAFILLFYITVLTSSTTTDQLALLAFKNTITSDPHGHLSNNWSTATSVCNWVGVTCNLTTQRVTTLNLSRFALGGTITPHIANLTFLRSLDVSFNNFTGTLPSELATLPRLEEFNAGVNSFRGPIPLSIFNISTLRMLQLSFNQFDGVLPSTMGISLYNLERLYMNGNRLSGPIPTSITNASKLTVLEMAQNSFTGSIPNFGDLRFLRVLRIQGNNLTGADSSTQELGFLSSLTSCRHLEVLDVSENPLNGILPAATVGNLSTSLVQFRASKCNINGVIPPEIGNLSSVITLYMDGNQLQGSIPHHLCQMNSLAELDLSANMLTGSIPECFGEVESLRKISLGSNKLNSTLPSNFWDLDKLLTLNLSSNYLSGNLSSQIGNLKAIYRMDLSWNQFSGDIPSSLDGCQLLETLSLSNNMLTGSIPQSLGSVRGLIRLDFSYNNLSGLIPESLEKLRFLEHFDVSYNSLDGEIPNEGPFINFTALSFVNNSALCGSSRFDVPPCMKRDGISRSRLKHIALLMVYIFASFISVIIWVIVMYVLTRIPLHSSNHHQLLTSDHTLLGVSWKTISYRELMLVTDGFSEENLVGRGATGSVYKGTLPDGFPLAIKVFNSELEGAAEIFGTETEILRSLRHRNLIRVIGCCANAEFKALVLAYRENGSLEKWLYSDGYCLDLVQRINIAVDVALALEYLHHYHTFPIAHCDVKPSNVLLDEDLTAQVSDFGVAKLFDNAEAEVQTTTFQGTIGYAPPELGLEGSVTTKADVYSYGIMLLELFTRKKPTDNMFNGEMGLKEWVCDAIERNVMRKVVDPALLSTLQYQNFLPKEWVDEAIERNGASVHPALLSEQDQPFLPKVLQSVFYLAIRCLAYSPRDRIDMIEAAFILQKIKYNVDSEMTRKSSPYYSIAESPPLTRSQLSVLEDEQDLNGTLIAE